MEKVNWDYSEGDKISFASGMQGYEPWVKIKS